MTSTQRWSFALLLVLFVALATAYNVLQPLWEAPDEPNHFAFVRYVQTTHALPRGQPDMPADVDPWNPISEFDQMPLYYVVLAAILSPVKLLPDAGFHRNPYVSWPGHPWRDAVALHRTDEGWPYSGLALFVHLGRLVSTFFGLLTLVVTYAVVVAVSQDVATGLFATAWIALSPGFLLASSRLDNDAAAMGFGSLCLLVCAARLTQINPATMRDLALLSVCLTGALLSKLNLAFLVPLAVVAAAVAAEPALPITTAKARRIASVMALLVLPGATVGVWWLSYGRTFKNYVGSAIGFGVVGIWSQISSLEIAHVGQAIAYWHDTWWGGVGFGTLNLWPAAVYILLAIPTIVLASAGAYSLFVSRRCWDTSAAIRRRAGIILCLATIPLFYATLARQALPAVGHDANARFTLPSAPAIALLIALGGQYLPLGRYRRLFATSYLVGLFGFALTTAFVLLPSIPAPEIPARLARDDHELTRAPLASFGNGVDLLDVDGVPDGVKAGDPLSVNLTWRVRQQPPDDFVATLQVVDLQRQQRIAGVDAVPDQSVFPPRQWESDEIVDDRRTLTLPTALPPGVYALRVGAYYLRQNRPEPIPLSAPLSEKDAVGVTTWRVLPNASGLSDARPAAASFGQSLLLRGYDVGRHDDGVRVTLYWMAQSPIREHLVVSIQVLGASGRLIAQHDGEPVDGRLPTTDWPTGEIVRDDHDLATLPSLAQTQMIVVVYDRQTLRRLPVMAEGSAPSDHFQIAP